MDAAAIAALSFALIVIVILCALLVRQAGRIDALNDETHELRATLQGTTSLEGREVIANTPKPDDQSIRGVVTRELEDGRLVLAAAAYLEPGRNGIEPRPLGDVVVTRPAFVQIITPTA